MEFELSTWFNHERFEKRETLQNFIQHADTQLFPLPAARKSCMETEDDRKSVGFKEDFAVHSNLLQTGLLQT
jgi:hypothetical protein